VLANPTAATKLKNLYIQTPLARLSYCETYSTSQPYKKSFKCDTVLSLAFLISREEGLPIAQNLEDGKMIFHSRGKNISEWRSRHLNSRNPQYLGNTTTTQHMAAAETLRHIKDSPSGNLGVAESSNISTNEFLPKICSRPMARFETD